MMLFDKAIESGATFSECRAFRYSLFRVWDAELTRLVCVGLNPSTADERQDDPTIRRVIGFAKQWAFGGISMLNLFAYRATEPTVMLAHSAPIGPENNEAIRAEISKAGMVLVAWGNSAGNLGVKRALEVLAIVRECKKTPMCLGVTASGQPKHPLYIPADFQPIEYKG